MKSAQKSDNDLALPHLSARATDRQQKLTLVDHEILRKHAAKLQFSRNLRRKELDPDILGEPAWDILLALFVIDNDKRRMSIGELARTTNIPQTTAIRWVTALEERDLARRRPNPLDQRAVQVELTKKGRTSMESYFLLTREADIFR